MNSYKYFSKYELSFIFNNERRYAPQIISDLKAYCHTQKIDLKKVKSKRESWDLLNQDRLSRKQQSDRLVISKKRSAKVSDYRQEIFWMFIVIILLCLSIYRLTSFRSLDYIEKVSLIIGVPILILILSGFYEKIKEMKTTLDERKEIQFFQSNQVDLLKNNDLEFSANIEEVKLIWTKDRNEDNTEIILNLLFANGESYEVDKSRNYFEIFDTFSQIVQFTNSKFSLVQM